MRDENTKLTELNKKIIEIKQQISKESEILKELKAVGKRYETFNPANEEHQKHFNNQFKIFIGSGGQSNRIKSKFSSKVAATIDD